MWWLKMLKEENNFYPTIYFYPILIVNSLSIIKYSPYIN